MILGADTLVPLTETIFAMVRERFGTTVATRRSRNGDAPTKTPNVALPCPILLWQFAIRCLFDGGVAFDVVNPNPALASALRNRLVFSR